jgi:amino acid adenylation domain-containing protein
MGVKPRDRVGIYLTKSIDSVASIFGILKTGAAYVPVDPHAPPSRNAYVLGNCSVQTVIVESKFVEPLREELARQSASPCLLVLEGAGNGQPLQSALAREDRTGPAPTVQTVVSDPDDLAYLLYTSGSTGKPKGVMISQRNALSFVNWCSEAFEPHEEDRFSSHAPFHFDLSILDIYVPIKHGATVVLVGHEVGKEPARLAPLISDRRLSIWYSTPSILSLLARYGSLEQHDYSQLRMVLFAGEVFPVKYLRMLNERLPHPRYFNLYGPTETNVCTYYEVPSSIPEDRTEPYPIGKTCSHYEARVVDIDGNDLAVGEEGELCMHGPGVTEGYWGLAEQTARAFLIDGDNRKWYRTGDLVVQESSGDFIYRGRRDRMVKKRGYRVELGEIEACLYQHPDVRQAAVIAVADEDGIKIKAFLSAAGERKVSVIALKKHCSERIPLYMVPDTFSFLPSLPTTSTDKIDYQSLKELA